MSKTLRERLEVGNAYICELHYKNDDIEFIVFVMLIASTKFPEREKNSRHPAFMS